MRLTDETVKIHTQKLLLSNCSLTCDRLGNNSPYFSFCYKGLDFFGSRLEHVDFSQNNLTRIKFGDESGYDWPNLRTFNLSRNLLTDFGQLYPLFNNMP